MVSTWRCTRRTRALRAPREGSPRPSCRAPAGAAGRAPPPRPRGAGGRAAAGARSTARAGRARRRDRAVRPRSGAGVGFSRALLRSGRTARVLIAREDAEYARRRHRDGRCATAPPASARTRAGRRACGPCSRLRFERTFLESRRRALRGARSIHSTAAASGSAGLIRKPWPRSQPRPARSSQVSASSIPSATICATQGVAELDHRAHDQPRRARCGSGRARRCGRS